MIFINWETGGAASYIFFLRHGPSSRYAVVKTVKIYIQGLKMMDEIAEVST